MLPFIRSLLSVSIQPKRGKRGEEGKGRNTTPLVSVCLPSFNFRSPGKRSLVLGLGEEKKRKKKGRGVGGYIFLPPHKTLRTVVVIDSWGERGGGGGEREMGGVSWCV